jgi:AbrB family looped-hinge helix DNA binding protein
MSSAVVMSRGRVTIPKEVRDRLKLRAGTRVRFVVESGGVASMRRETLPITDLVGFLAPTAHAATIEQMNRAAEDAAVDRLRRSDRKKR